MIGIGLRVYSNKKIFYSIIELTDEMELIFITNSFLTLPLSLNEPERFSYLRNALIDIFSEYNIENALVRVKETMRVQVKDIPRYYIEGVLLEAMAGSTVQKYELGKIANMTRLLGIDRADFKRHVDGDLDYENIPDDWNWSEFSKEERESLLAGISSLNL